MLKRAFHVQSLNFKTRNGFKNKITIDGFLLLVLLYSGKERESNLLALGHRTLTKMTKI